MSVIPAPRANRLPLRRLGTAACALGLAILPAAGPAQATETFKYDELGRLVCVQYSDASVVRYYLDASGNRIAVTSVGPGSGDNCSLVAPAPPTSTPPPPDNRAPVAVNDSYSFEFTSFPASATLAVRSNDTDADGDPLTITAVTQPTGATTSIVGNAIQISGMAANGSYTFTYTISDGKGATATATASVYSARQEPEEPPLECGGPRQPKCP